MRSEQNRRITLSLKVKDHDKSAQTSSSVENFQLNHKRSICLCALEGNMLLAGRFKERADPSKLHKRLHVLHTEGRIHGSFVGDGQVWNSVDNEVVLWAVGCREMATGFPLVNGRTAQPQSRSQAFL